MKQLFYIYIFLIGCAFSACSSNSQAEEQEETEMNTPQQQESKIIHVVYFWLKEGATQEERKQFENELEALGKCPQILNYKWGTAVNSERDVVDDSFDYSWIVEFASKQDMDDYGVDPIHLKFIENSEDLWQTVKVYDATIE